MEVIYMIIVKHLWNQEMQVIPDGISRPNSRIQSSTFSYIISEEQMYNAYNCNYIKTTKGETTSTGLIFGSGDYFYFMSFHIPEEFVSYTKCYNSIVTTDFEDVECGFYRASFKSKTTLIFDGPDELALQWRLSI